MLRLLLLLLFPCIAWAQSYPNPTLGHMLNLRGQFGAVGNGTTDDSGALAAAINYVNGSNCYGASPRVACAIYAPAGVYLIKNTNGTMPGFAANVPGAIIGDGVHKTYFLLDSGYVGDLFSWSEAWDTNYSNGMNPNIDWAGPIAHDFSVFGNTSAASQQNAFRLYDRNDFVNFRDLDVFYLNGECFSVGRTKNQTQAFMRESQVNNLRCFYTGTSTQPAVEISSTSTSGSDATNTDLFVNLNVFASAGRGIVVSGPGTYANTRGIVFLNARSEGNAGDALTLGLSGDLGTVSNIKLYGLLAPSVASGHYALVIGAGSGPTPYSLMVRGVEANGAGSGILVSGVNANQLLADYENIGTTGPALTVSTSNVIQISTPGCPTVSIGTSTGFCTSPALVPVAVASLPSCTSGIAGQKMYVNNATQTLTAGIGAVVAGGGANTVPVGCDGTNWRIGG